jgi:hypothetical protein
MKRLTFGDVLYFAFAPLFTMFLYVHLFLADVYDTTIVARRPLKNVILTAFRYLGKGLMFFVSDSIASEFRVQKP